MSKNYINVSVSTSKPTRVSVSTPENQKNVDVTRDTSAYNAEIAKQWATSENLVLNEDYSAKHYAKEAKKSEQNAESFESATRETYNSFVSDANSYINELTETKEVVTEEISMAASDGLLDIRNAKEEAVENVENVGADVIADIQENGKSLPMFTSIWTDHIYNDASYLRADTFSWQNADIYVTGYEILENEYNNENCVTETENGIEYRLSPNGFKIADASQSDAILNLYESGKNAWFYIIDTENRKFKLPREKSNEHKYLYFYVGNYSRPDTEINLGILAELANSQDLDSVLASINEVKDNGIAELEATTASGVSSITTTANTGVNNINNATTAGVKTINDTTNAGKTAIQQIVNAGVPLATLETAGIVRPDGETITIVDGVISSAGGTGDAIVITEAYVNGNNGYNVYSNGYCEQWGNISVKQNTKASLLKPYKDTNYNIQLTLLDKGGAVGYGSYFTSVTTTSFNIIVIMIGMGVTPDSGTVHWRTCGYIS